MMAIASPAAGGKPAAGLFEVLSSPSDCAVLIAPPLTFEEFGHDVQAAQSPDPRLASGDYAFEMAESNGGDVENAWREHGSFVAELCLELIEDARAVGVQHVYERATASSIAEVTQRGVGVVLLVAHWRPLELTSLDLRPGAWTRLREGTENQDDEFLADLGCHVAELERSQGSQPRDSQLAHALNGFLRSGAEADSARRNRLDELFDDVVVPGNALELRDGYHKSDTLAGQVADDWSGVFDLGVCHSIELAVALKQGRDDRRVLTNELQKQPDRCLREMREALLRLSEAPANYIHLRAEIFKIYSAMSWNT